MHKQNLRGCKRHCCTFCDIVSQALLSVRLASLLLVSWFFCGCNCCSSQREHTKLLNQHSWSQIHPDILTYCNTLEQQHWTSQSGCERLGEMIPDRAFLFGGNLLQIFPELSSKPLRSLGLGLGPSVDDLSRCFRRNAGVTVVLWCALLCIQVHCIHIHYIPSLACRTEGAQWGMKPGPVPKSLPLAMCVQTYRLRTLAGDRTQRHGNAYYTGAGSSLSLLFF